MILQRLWAESNPDPRSTAPVGVTRNMLPSLFWARDLEWGWRDKQEINRVLFN